MKSYMQYHAGTSNVDGKNIAGWNVDVNGSNPHSPPPLYCHPPTSPPPPGRRGEGEGEGKDMGEERRLKGTSLIPEVT